MDPDKLAVSTTTDGLPPRPGFESKGAPAPIDPKTGMHEAYWILSREERERGFQRPVRRSYLHVGVRPEHPTRPLTDEERERHAKWGYVLFEEYPESEFPKTGRFWTQAQLESGCGTRTVMSIELAETYARDPKYYGATFCCACRMHLPVSEFVWDGTDERVGS